MAGRFALNRVFVWKKHSVLAPLLTDRSIILDLLWFARHILELHWSQFVTDPLN